MRILDSIVTPPKFLQTERAFDMMKILQLFNQISDSWRVQLPRYFPSLTSIPLQVGDKPLLGLPHKSLNL